MKRVIFSFVTLLMVTVLILPAATPVLADSYEAIKIQPAWSTALMIKTPNAIEVGQPLTVTVFTKRSQKTLAGVSVYALKATDLVTAADSTDYTTLLAQYEATAKSGGLFMGITGSNGSVTGKLADSGRFVLVAIKDSFAPGFARISAVPAAEKGLNIKAPGSIEVNKPATIAVYERFAQQPVAGAAVYAQLINVLNVPSVGTSGGILKKALTATPVISQNATASVKLVAPSIMTHSSPPQFNASVIRADPANMDAVARYAAEIASTGTLLGYTGTDGKLTYTFASYGVYVLVATRANYKPGLTRIFVRISNQAKLAIKSPDSADIGDNVTFTITGHNTGQGIGGANLWAPKIDDIKGTAESVRESRIKIHFSSQQRLAVKTPWSSPSDQQVTIKAINRSNGKPVEKAIIYAFKARIKIQPSPRLTENGTATQMITDAIASNTVDDKEAEELLVQSASQPIVIGYTDGNGEVNYTFGQSGTFTLVAAKEGYLPGGTRINVRSAK